MADLLRGDYKQSEYGKVVLPLTVIRRLDCVLEPTKQAVLKKHRLISGRIENVEPLLQAAAGQQFFNTSPLTFTKLLDDPNTIADALSLYIGGFSEAARDIIDKFDFAVQIERLRRANVLYQVIGRFADIDLHPEVVSNIEDITQRAHSTCCTRALPLAGVYLAMRRGVRAVWSPPS